MAAVIDFPMEESEFPQSNERRHGMQEHTFALTLDADNAQAGDESDVGILGDVFFGRELDFLACAGERAGFSGLVVLVGSKKADFQRKVAGLAALVRASLRNG